MQPQNEPRPVTDFSTPEDGSIPAFLKRPFPNESEREIMYPVARVPYKPRYAASEEAGAAEAETEAPKAKATPKVKAKANGKATVKASAKPAAKAAPAKPAKAKGKAAAEHKVDPDKVDAYGFRKGSIKSKAAAMYAKGKGATLNEVKVALGSVQFNLLNDVKEKGFKVETTEVKGHIGRMVTRYKIV